MEALFRNTLGPIGWIVMATIPLAIIALYFLKLKRQPIEVPSTYLWHQVMEDLHVNSLWQRLRKSLLLLLQLLVAALAILALLRPGWQGEALVGQRFIFLVDNSASMSAADADNRATRLDQARERVGMLIDQLQSDMSAMIITFANEPLVVQQFTSNRRTLREALNRIVPTSATTDLSGALRLARGFANPGRMDTDLEAETTPDDDAAASPPVSLFILSDGRFAAVDDFSLGNLQAQFLPLGTPTAFNMGFTALNTRRGGENSDQLQVFAQVANASPEDATAVVSLFHNGQLIDAMEVSTDAGEVGSVTFLLEGDATGPLHAVLEPPADYPDRLALDNTAYAVIDNRRQARVLLITPGNSALELVLTTERAKRLAQVEMLTPTAIDTPEYKQRIGSERYDLIIYDRCVPQEMPPANTLFIGRRPPAAGWITGQSSDEVAAPQVIDWQRSHPLLSLIELGDLSIAGSLIVPPPAGGRVLIDSTSGPLVAITPRDRFEDVVVGFEILSTNDAGERTFNTNWPFRHSFPSFWLNVLEYFSGDPGGQETLRPGELVEVQLPRSEGSVEVMAPDGTRFAVEADSGGRVAFQETERPGIYQIFQDGIIVKQFAVNLFDREESDVALRTDSVGEQGLPVVSGLKIGYVEVAARGANSDVRKELWKPLLLMALVVLVVEWYIYNRRVYI